jgi:hypothetical protein
VLPAARMLQRYFLAAESMARASGELRAATARDEAARAEAKTRESNQNPKNGQMEGAGKRGPHYHSDGGINYEYLADPSSQFDTMSRDRFILTVRRVLADLADAVRKKDYATIKTILDGPWRNLGQYQPVDRMMQEFVHQAMTAYRRRRNADGNLVKYGVAQQDDEGNDDGNDDGDSDDDEAGNENNARYRPAPATSTDDRAAADKAAKVLKHAMMGNNSKARQEAISNPVKFAITDSIIDATIKSTLQEKPPGAAGAVQGQHHLLQRRRAPGAAGAPPRAPSPARRGYGGCAGLRHAAIRT